MRRPRTISRLGTAFAVLASSLTALVTLPGGASAASPTLPSAETARSLYANNWTDTTGLWMASQLAQTDTSSQFGPRLAELHYSPNGAQASSAVNQIKDYTGFFRDETHGTKYDQVHNFGSASGYLDSGGVLRSDYGPYAGSATSVSIGRDYAFVPDQHFAVVTYRLTNPGTSAVDMNVLDSLHVNNTGAGSGRTVHATWDATRNAAVIDMSASGQYHLVLGSFGAPTSHQVGDDTVSSTGSATVAPWFAFDATGTLPGNDSVTATDVDAALTKRVTVPAGQTVTTSFYLAIADTAANSLAAADTARAQSGAYWNNATTTAYTNWLDAGKRVSFTDTGLSTAYDRALVAIKQTQNPALGTFPAATNPIAYGYKTWVRDSAVTAMALDAAGHHAEADKYFRWLAGIQYADGSFGTTYDNWTGQHVDFVEPEHDGIGIFLVGAYRHWQETGDNAFRDALWPQITKAANFVATHMAGNGLGPADASIWEETQEYNTFTQSLYIAGLWGAEAIAQSKGDTTDADAWSDTAASISTALQSSSLNSPAGLWNSPDAYYNRAVNLDNTGRVTVDASSDMLFVSGAVDPASSRAASHVAKIKATLTHDTYGIARYTGDGFYYNSPYSPAGNEALAAEPSWPQMSMYLALYAHYTGDQAGALQELTWYAGRTAVGYMPPGEAVSNVSQKPIVSTMVEPVTGAWYVLAALGYTGQADTRSYAPVSKAGAHAGLTVKAGTAGDWPQWAAVPYYASPVGTDAGTDAGTDIRNVAVANDDNNVYVRIDNASGTLPGYQATSKFSVNVYAGDYSGSTGTSTSTSALYGAPLSRPAAFMVGRTSDSATYNHFHVSGGSWVNDSAITSVIAPQWDPATGRIEVVIPRSALTSGAAADGSTVPITIALARQNPTTLAWTEADTVSLRYRLTGAGAPSIYGNVR
ncbi:glycoside hydrolase family 15 protein [Streptomyces sp. NBC_00316]|uniref:glycoside hydrolase family 15 protein n=1 Tax=Streptomyces sp. NBC_00316 TaxID=2975710 RepID=UPI002E29A805|nr:glycoside hydrolase family 15 protein [Streptomyces sp. NBC_00316]